MVVSLCYTQSYRFNRGDNCIWEQAPLQTLAEKGELMAYEHAGFWQPMDTLRDRVNLEELWATQAAPWKSW